MERLNDIYLELLDWLRYEGESSKCIWHPLFYTYPWGLRFELGDPVLDDKAAYIQSAKERGQRIWKEVFAPEDEVLMIFDVTPEPVLKQELKHCRMQRVRAKNLPAFPGDDEEYEDSYFYRYLYAAVAGEIPFDTVLTKIVEGEMVVVAKVYSSSVYFYNRTKKLLFHPYDDRGADLIAADPEALRPFYNSLHDLLLDWDREEMARKFRPVRKVYLRVLTTTTDAERVAQVRSKLEKRFCGAELTFSDLGPYWKCDGWGELSVTMDTAQPLDSIQKRLADRWESDTANDGICLPDVGFLWVCE